MSSAIPFSERKNVASNPGNGPVSYYYLQKAEGSTDSLLFDLSTLEYYSKRLMVRENVVSFQRQVVTDFSSFHHQLSTKTHLYPPAIHYTSVPLHLKYFSQASDSKIQIYAEFPGELRCALKNITAHRRFILRQRETTIFPGMSVIIIERKWGG